GPDGVGHRRSVLAARVATRADCPDRLAGGDETCVPERHGSRSTEGASQLTPDDVDLEARLPLAELFADAQDRTQAGLDGAGHPANGDLVGLRRVAAAPR